MIKLMASNTPIYNIAKELDVDSNKIILACKKLGINAKGAAKRLNKLELEKVIHYFETGKNVSEEVIEINKNKPLAKTKLPIKKIKSKIIYFPNRLIDKS